MNFNGKLPTTSKIRKKNSAALQLDKKNTEAKMNFTNTLNFTKLAQGNLSEQTKNVAKRQ